MIATPDVSKRCSKPLIVRRQGRGCIVLLLALAATCLSFAGALTPVTEKALKNADIIPDIVDGVSLDAGVQESLRIEYGSSSVDSGNLFPQSQVNEAPDVIFDSDHGLYTLMMVDPDAPSPKEPKMRNMLHWCITNVPGGKLGKGDDLAPYKSPAPPKGTHRYVLMFFHQKGGNPISADKFAESERGKFSVRDFADKHSLGEPVAVNWFTARAPSSPSFRRAAVISEQ